MAKEIERKFLVIDDSYRFMASSSVNISQGYLSYDPDKTVRIRIKGDRAFLTVKSRSQGAVRNEWEYEIPLRDAEDIILNCNVNCLEKTRYFVPFDDNEWEVDEFHGKLSGLVVAEIELCHEDQIFAKPPFIGEDVTSDPSYFNSSLLKRVTSDSDI